MCIRDRQKAAYLTALSMKGETIDEITASAAAMRAHGEKLLHNMDVLEIVGTGGDGSNSFNISTTCLLYTSLFSFKGRITAFAPLFKRASISSSSFSAFS